MTSGRSSSRRVSATRRTSPPLRLDTGLSPAACFQLVTRACFCLCSLLCAQPVCMLLTDCSSSSGCVRVYATTSLTASLTMGPHLQHGLLSMNQNVHFILICSVQPGSLSDERTLGLHLHHALGCSTNVCLHFSSCLCAHHLGKLSVEHSTLVWISGVRPP